MTGTNRVIFAAILALLITAEAAGTARASGAEPFRTRNASPVSLIFGLPEASGGRIVPSGATEVFLGFDASNSYYSDRAPGELIWLDGETHRILLSLRHGVARKLEIGLEIPFLSHSGGFLDSAIDRFHDLIGQEENTRSTAPEDRLNYQYVRDGVSRIWIREPTAGIGDVTVSAATPLFGRHPGSPRAMSLRAGLKLPTGDPDRLLGSGGTDLHLQLGFTEEGLGRRWNVTLNGSAGIALLGRSDLFRDLQRTAVGFGSAGLGWAPVKRLALKLQFDARSPLSGSSGVATLRDWSFQVAAGGTVELGGRISIDLAITENVFVDASPDVVLHAALRTRFPWAGDGQ